MKKFLAILCAAVMVAGLATSAFASEVEGNASPGDPINAYDGDYGEGTGAGAGGTGFTGGGTGGNVGGGAATTGGTTTGGATTDGGATTTDGGAGGSSTSTGTGTSAVVVANIADYTEDSLAKILVSMLNSPAENSQVYTSADVIKAMKIDGTDEKTVKGTPVDTSKLTVITKALDEKSTGVKYTQNDDKTFSVEMNGNELTKGRKSEELIAIVAPKAPITEEPKAYLADVEISDANVATFDMPKDAAICLTLIQK